jgi:uncharacterized protein YjbJ (UPF0337 family)
MNERVDELKGDVKQGLGKITGNERLEAEGKAEHDVAKAEREAKGAANQLKGRVKEEVGKLTGNENLEAEGAADRLKGDVQRTG